MGPELQPTYSLSCRSSSATSCHWWCARLSLLLPRTTFSPAQDRSLAWRIPCRASSLFRPTVDGFTWGVGPALQYRTGTDSLLTTGKWGAGPTAVVLQQTGPWTVGVLANHVWSFAGDADRSDVSNTFLQPFISYAAAGGWTYTVNTQSTYDWVAQQWSVPLLFQDIEANENRRTARQSCCRGKILGRDASSGPHGLAGLLSLTFIFK